MKRTNILFKSFTAFIIALAMVSCEIDSFSEESQFEFGDITAPSNLTLSAEIVVVVQEMDQELFTLLLVQLVH